MRCVERTGSFMVNLIAVWFIIITAYFAVLSGQYPAAPHWLYSFVELTFYIYPVLAIALIINRNWLRKARWVNDVVIPETPFYLSNYQTSKLVFNEDHLRVEPRFLFFRGKVKCLYYDEIESVELIIASNLTVASIIYYIGVHIKDSNVNISVDSYNAIERVTILKTLKKKCPTSKFNRKAKMYLSGYFLQRVPIFKF